MAKFMVPVTIELQIEATSVQEAFRKFQQWRKFIMAAISGRLGEAGIHRIKIKPAHEFIEVDAAWQYNHVLRRKFQQEWEYDTRLEPVVPGSKLMLSHQIALGPKGDLMEQKHCPTFVSYAVWCLSCERVSWSNPESDSFFWVCSYPDCPAKLAQIKSNATRGAYWSLLVHKYSAHCPAVPEVGHRYPVAEFTEHIRSKQPDNPYLPES